MDMNQVLVDPGKVLAETQNTLRKLLDVPAYIPEKAVTLAVEDEGITQEEFDKIVDEDFTVAHQNFRELIEKGKGSLNSLIVLAGASDNPRAYEVVATLLKTLADMNGDMINLHEKRKKAKVVDTAKGPTNTTNNNLFVGSASDVLEMLNKNHE